MVIKREINLLDNLYSKASRELISELYPHLSYKSFFWKNMGYRKIKTEYTKSLIDKKGIFLNGFLPKIKKIFPEVKINGELEKINNDSSPFLKGIEFLPGQIKLIDSAIKNPRGVLIAPTGYGKTVTVAGYLSAFPNNRILFLCHTIDLLEQTIQEFKKFGFTDICKIGDGNKIIDGRIVVSTIQTLAKIHFEEWFDKFDITVIDECHHCIDINSQYGKVMSTNLSPRKIGVTATLPNEIGKALNLEALIGPVIAKVTHEEAVRHGRILSPDIELINIDTKSKKNNYQSVYKEAIVENKKRNRIIIKEAKKTVNNDETCLIMCSIIKHTDLLKELALSANLDPYIVKGDVNSETREYIKKALREKKIKLVIGTNVFDEGVDIPSLDHVINAAGMKSEIKTMQKIGRGLRTSKGKTKVKITDFIDSSKYLKSHSIERINTYKKMNWL